jgi:hypothetical protein
MAGRGVYICRHGSVCSGAEIEGVSPTFSSSGQNGFFGKPEKFPED